MELARLETVPLLPVVEEEPKKGEEGLNIGLTTSIWYLMSDIPAIVANCQLIEFFQRFVGPPVIAVQSGLKISSSGGMLSGALKIIEAYGNWLKANVIGDVGGQINAQIGLLRGGFEALSGTVMAAVRTLSIIGSRTTAKVIVAAQAVLGIASTVIGSLQFALIALPFAVNGMKAYNFLNELMGRDDEKAFAFLQEQVRLNEKDWHDAQAVIENGGGSALDLTAQELDMLTLEDWQKIQATADVEDYNMLAREIANMYMVKEAKYKRRARGDSLAMLRNDRLGLAPANPKETVKLAKIEANANLELNEFIVATCVIGIVSFILATVYVSGPILALAFILMLVMNVMMTYLDATGLYDELKAAKELSTKDKVVMVAFAVFTTFCMTAGTVLSGGLFEVALVLGTGAIMLAVQGGSVAYLHYKPQEEKASQV